MADPFVGEIRFAGSYAPQGWLACDGSQVQISENEILFIIGHHLRRRRCPHICFA
jgi:microcystin-dependent protein